MTSRHLSWTARTKQSSEKKEEEPSALQQPGKGKTMVLPSDPTPPAPSRSSSSLPAALASATSGVSSSLSGDPWWSASTFLPLIPFLSNPQSETRAVTELPREEGLQGVGLPPGMLCLPLNYKSISFPFVPDHFLQVILRTERVVRQLRRGG